MCITSPNLLKISIVFCFLAILNSCSSDSPKSVNSVSETQNQLPENERIEKLYKMNCKSCHGRNGNAGLGGAAKLGKSTLDVNQAILSITNGGKKMQPFKGILNTQEISDLANYIQQFKQAK